MNQTTNINPDTGLDIGVIGNRHLIGVQTFDIARLTSHPIPLVPSRFIAVTGQGAEGDSNGSGKTSFLAAISLLLGDVQWRLESSGVATVRKLLFDPRAAGLRPGHGQSISDHGYIVGLFADDDSRVEDDAITVWLRISSTPQYLSARWAPGMHVVVAEDYDLDLIDAADATWNSLPKDKKHELGPTKLRETLYGKAAKGIAYVDTVMRKSAPSLLSQELTQMSPEQIGNALIELTGRQQLLESEDQQRNLLSVQETKLEDLKSADRDRRIGEDDELTAVHNRDLARDHLKQGQDLWILHFAKGYLHNLKAHEKLESTIGDLESDRVEVDEAVGVARGHFETLRASTDLEERAREAARTVFTVTGERKQADRNLQGIESRIRELTKQRSELREKTKGGDIVPLDEARRDSQKAEAELKAAEGVTSVAQAKHLDAEAHLTEVKEGRGGEAGHVLDALRAAGIQAHLLLDEVSLSDEARVRWEPILWAHRTTVVVEPRRLEDALQALSDRPRAVVAPADDTFESSPGALPEGVTSTIPVASLLTQMANRYSHAEDPARAIDNDLRQHTIGGFPAQIAGLAARLQQAEMVVAETLKALSEAEKAEKVALSKHQLATAGLQRAEAADKLIPLESQLQEVSQQREPAASKLATLEELEEEKRRSASEAEAAAQSHEMAVENARLKLVAAQNELSRRAGFLKDKKAEQDRLHLVYWRRGWGGSPESAQAALDRAAPGVAATAHGSLRRRAADRLQSALDGYCANIPGPPPSDLKEAMDKREQLADGGTGFGGNDVNFETVARPLRNLLDQQSESDQIRATRIAHDQRGREQNIVDTEVEVDQKRQNLKSSQDMVSRQIEAALKRISARLNELVSASGGGWGGANLRIEETRPISTTDTWKWAVTPEWKRSGAGTMVDYKTTANGAQIKVFAIKLVLAALLADSGAEGRVLVIDELGNSLGDIHRQEVLRNIGKVAREQKVTILGTCQDSVIADASHECGQILWFSHANEADPFNQPTRIWDYDENRNRVEATRDWIAARRTLV